MYQLHIANKNYSSWSLRPWVLMRTLGIDFEERLWLFGTDTSGHQFKHFSPSGKVPCLVDDGTVVWDTLAITEYLAERHPGVWPKDTNARTWGRCAAAEMHSGFSTLRNCCSMTCGMRVRLHEVPEALERDIARIDELWRDGLSRFGGPFLGGASFTAVDAFFAPVAFRIQSYGLKLGNVATSYAERLLALPAMKEWYEAALREPWRDEIHEAEIKSAGALIADLRQAP